jgi:hypothetical protein
VAEAEAAAEAEEEVVEVEAGAGAGLLVLRRGLFDRTGEGVLSAFGLAAAEVEAVEWWWRDGVLSFSLLLLFEADEEEAAPEPSTGFLVGVTSLVFELLLPPPPPPAPLPLLTPAPLLSSIKRLEPPPAALPAADGLEL